MGFHKSQVLAERSTAFHNDTEAFQKQYESVISSNVRKLLVYRLQLKIVSHNPVFLFTVLLAD